jgi:hypothetical protein
VFCSTQPKAIKPPRRGRQALVLAQPLPPGQLRRAAAARRWSSPRPRRGRLCRRPDRQDQGPHKAGRYRSRALPPNSSFSCPRRSQGRLRWSMRWQSGRLGPGREIGSRAFLLVRTLTAFYLSLRAFATASVASPPGAALVITRHYANYPEVQPDRRVRPEREEQRDGHKQPGSLGDNAPLKLSVWPRDRRLAITAILPAFARRAGGERGPAVATFIGGEGNLFPAGAATGAGVE